MPLRGVGLCLAAAAGFAACRARVEPGPLAHTASGAPVHWSLSVVTIEVVTPPERSGIGAGVLTSALQQGIDAWNEALRGCKAPTLKLGRIWPAGAAREDGRNVVVINGAYWCPEDRAAVLGCYDKTVQATTHLRARDDPGHEGELREADIEINAIAFRWSLRGDVKGIESLRAVLVHELGHVLGLEDICDMRLGATPVGDGGAAEPLPMCDLLRRGTSVMYPETTDHGWAPAPTPDAVAALCPSGTAHAPGCALRR